MSGSQQTDSSSYSSRSGIAVDIKPYDVTHPTNSMSVDKCFDADLLFLECGLSNGYQEWILTLSSPRGGGGGGAESGNI